MLKEETIHGLALCAGIGGLELGLHSALGDRYRCVGYVERDAYAAATLVARMEDKALDKAPIWDDLASFSGRGIRGGVDIVSVGFPCQPFSTASRGRRVCKDLWPEVARIVRECEPRYVFCENVQREPIERAASDLHQLGFKVAYGDLCASDLGAAFERRRWWLLADAHHTIQPILRLDAEVASIQATTAARWEELPAGVLGVGDGISNWMDRVRCLGNAVVPQVAETAFSILCSELRT